MSDVTGKDLSEMGFAPAPWFGEALLGIGARRLSSSQAARIAQGHVDGIAAAQPILLIRGERNLGFAPHGAGRNLSRTAHKRATACRTPEEAFAVETAGIDARFFCGRIDVSELPSVLKSADRVRADMARFGLADVVDGVRPSGSIMAGDWEADAPWRRRGGSE